MDLTREIGGGHNPSPNADVVVDKYLFDNTERGGELRIICPTVIADGERLPFRDKAFSRTIGRQVMEHMDDIGRFFEEMMRVSSGGTLASPSYLRELAFWWPYHRWLITKRGNELLCAPKTHQRPIAGLLFHYLGAHNRHFKKFVRSLPTGFLHVHYEWKDRINYRIVDQVELPDFSTHESIDAYMKEISANSSNAPYGMLKRWILRWCPTAALRTIDWGRKKYYDLRRARLRQDIDIDDLLVCPACRQDVRHEQEEYRCLQCGNSYPIVNGIPVFLLED